MNRIHRKIWSKRLGAYVAVAEITRSGGKSSGLTGALLGAVLLGATGLALAATVTGNTLPTGGQVVAGQAGITQAGNVLTVTQGSSKAAINWQSFSVGSEAKVNFVQPSAQAVALNQVLGSDVSVIQGSVNANGQVFLVNPNGVLFTPTAQVNVGALVASTQNISTADFMAGNYKFSGTSTASVENQGRITAAKGGAVALIAARVVNTGLITAQAGQVGLAAANTVTLDMGGPVLLRVSQGALEAVIEQNGGIRADGGTIYLTAQAAGKLAASVINHGGVTQAQTLAEVTGNIQVSADIVSHTGTLDASSSAGRGGNITVNAGTLIDAGTTTVNGAQAAGAINETAQSILQATAARLSADSRDGQGGRISLLGDAAEGGRAWLSGQVSATGVQGGDIAASAHQVVAAGFKADSSGTAQAGRIRIGGGWQGKDDTLSNAQTTRVGSDVQLTNQGAGGTVVVWSDQQTSFGGSIDAAQSAVEVSGKENLLYSGTTKSASLLLDPKNITIESERFKLDAQAFRDKEENSLGNFGADILKLDNGNVVITAPKQWSPTSLAGAVYLFSSTGALISTLAGSNDQDAVGSGGVKSLGNGNFVVMSPDWWNKGGAVTLVNGSTGLNGVVSSTNSLVGMSGDGVTDSGDRIGSGGVTVLSNGNYVVNSPHWILKTPTSNSVIMTKDVGAVTWGSGTAGVRGYASSSNSLIGSTTNDSVGSGGVTAMSSGGYVVVSPVWGTKRGAVTFVSDGATSGVSGAVSAANSLVGQYIMDDYTGGDQVGSGGLFKLSNGNYVVLSPLTNSAKVPVADPDNFQLLTGAVTWVDSKVGVTGVIGAANSMVGSIKNDKLGSGGIVEVGTPGSGNFVVISPNWSNGWEPVTKWWPDSGNVETTRWFPITTGAVTFVKGDTGLKGLLNSSNSLLESNTVRSTPGSGRGGVTVLANGNYVALGRSGATWADGNVGLSGLINSSNTLMIGNDGAKVFALSNGNYVVVNPLFASNAGAATWGNGSTGISGAVTSDNSLLGSSDAQTGSGGVKEVGGSNYVVLSPKWNSTAGAATWGSGTTGVKGVISADNSLVGEARPYLFNGSTYYTGDQLGAGGFTLLNSGNYVMSSYYWDYSKGAVTWGSGSAGVTGVISGSNSLVGQVRGEMVGYKVTALTNGNYVVSAPSWGGQRGAATWGSGTAGITGTISSVNSLVGAGANPQGDRASDGGVVALTNGNYVVVTPGALFDNRSSGGTVNYGAVTWGNGQTGSVGVIDLQNSLVGSQTTSGLADGGVKALSSGNYVVLSPGYEIRDNGNRVKVGAVTWGDGTSGAKGAISSANSLLGSPGVGYTDSFLKIGSTFAEVGSPGSGNYVVTTEARGQGAVTWGSGSAGVTGVVSSLNSLVGTYKANTVGDQVGGGGVTVLPNGDYIVQSPVYDAKVVQTNAVTWGDGNKGARGELTEANTLFNLGNKAVVKVIDGQAWVTSPATGYAYRINGGVVKVASDTVDSATFANKPTENSSITPDVLKATLDQGTAVTLQANNDITVNSALTVSANGSGGALTLLAGRYININAAVSTDNGNFTAVAGSKHADLVADQKVTGNPTLTIGPAGSINAGTGTVTMSTMLFENQNSSASTVRAGVSYLALPFYNGQGGYTTLKLGGQTQDGKRYSSIYDESKGAVDCQFAGCVLPTSGFNVLYATAPILLVQPKPQAMFYGETFKSAGYTLSGFQDGDDATKAGLSGTPVINAIAPGPVSGAAMLRAGTYDLMYSGEGMKSSVGYSLAPDTLQKGQLVVTPTLIPSIIGLGAPNKVYDGKTTTKLNLSNLTPWGVLANDVVIVDTTNAVGSFADKNVARGKPVSITGITLSGKDAANYRLAELTVTANINPPSDPQSAGGTPQPGGSGGPSPGPTPPNTNPGNADPNSNPGTAPNSTPSTAPNEQKKKVP